ncbi:hypothetical protein GQ457_06G021000 [Hibiscus cannabinus]
MRGMTLPTKTTGASPEGPPHGWVKGNVDVAVNVSDGRAAVGGVFRDEDGTWLQGFARFIGRSSVLVVELWAIREGLHLAWNGGFRHVELETDNAEAARICNGLSTAMQNSILVSEIQEWLQRCWHVRVRYVDRASNAVADTLAKMGQRTLLQGGYFRNPPVEVLALVDAEQRHWEGRVLGQNPTVVQRPVRSWEGPPHGWVKGNVDVAVNVSDGRAAVGGVFRDEDGTWLQGFARFIGRSSVLVIELWAIREGLHLAWNDGFRHVELETDNAEAARICNGLSTAMQNSVLVSEIQEWLQRCWHVRVRYVDRASNAVADTLAKMGQRTLL